MSQTSLVTGPAAIAPPMDARPVERVRCSCGHLARYRMAAVMTLGRLSTFDGPGPFGIGCPECGASGWTMDAGREDRISQRGEVTNGTSCSPWEDSARAAVNGPEWSDLPVLPCPWPDRWICSCVRPIPEGTTDPCAECAADPAAVRRAKESARNLDRRDGPETGRPELEGWAGPVFAEPEPAVPSPETRAERIERATALASELRAARRAPETHEQPADPGAPLTLF